MKSAYFKELEKVTFEVIRDKLEISHEDTMELINSLEYNSRKIVKKYLDKKNGKIIYSFDFVGIIMYKNCIIKCIPKYYNNLYDMKENYEDRDKILKKIIDVIRKYGIMQDDITGFSEVDADKELNYLSVICYILDDYIQYGLYYNDKSVYELNGNGEIDWDRTINETQEYIVNGKPVYFDLVTSEIINNEDDYIRKIHKYVITQCSCMLKEHGILDILSYPFIEFDDADELYDDTDLIIDRISKELNTEFNSRKQELLRMLKLYFIHRQSYGQENYEGFVGTMDFNIVWEKICSAVLNNQLENRLGNIEAIENKYNKSYDLNRRLKDIIPYPFWKKEGCNHGVQASDTIELDLVSIFKQKDLRYFIIWDAKYYNLELTENKVKNNPGVQDIIKQYVYNLVYKSLIEEQKFDFSYNILLLPYEGEEMYFEGIAEFGILKDTLGVKDILVMKMPADLIFDLYLNNKLIDFDLIIAKVKEIKLNSNEKIKLEAN